MISYGQGDMDYLRACEYEEQERRREWERRQSERRRKWVASRIVEPVADPVESLQRQLAVRARTPSDSGTEGGPR